MTSLEEELARLKAQVKKLEEISRIEDPVRREEPLQQFKSEYSEEGFMESGTLPPESDPHPQ